MIRIVTESTCDIQFDEAKELGLHLIPMKLYFGDEEYIDKITITTGEFYEKLARSSTTPTTALTAPAEFSDIFEQYKDDTILVLLISKELSGTYNSACLAKQSSERDNIFVLDCRSVTIGNQLIIREACRMRDAGDSIETIIEKVKYLSEHIEITAMIDTLEYLVKGGRISGFSGFVGGILNLKPIIRVKNGVVTTIGKQRGSKKAFGHVCEEIKARRNTQYGAIAGFSQDRSRMDELCEMMDIPSDNVCEIGSVIGVHSGPGVVGVGYISNTKD